jgi:hypothetical protein
LICIRGYKDNIILHGKRGNQLLDDEKWGGYAPEEEHRTPNRGDTSPTGNAAKPGLSTASGKPQFAANDTPVHVTGLDDGADSFFGYKPEDYEEPSDALFGKKPKDYEDGKGATHSGGGYADFFREQREKDRVEWLEEQLADINLDINGMTEMDFKNKYSEHGFKSKERSFSKK